MDALTALSVATSVVSFVDFGSKLLSKSRKLYKSADGALTENVDIEIIVADIEKLFQGLRRKLPENRPLGNTSTGCTPFEDDGSLDVLCRRCVEIAAELMSRLDRLKVEERSDLPEGRKGRRRDVLFRSWESFRKALEASWNRDEIEDLAATLRDYRGEIEFRMLVMFRGSLNELATQQSQTSHQLAKATRIILDSFLDARESLSLKLQQQAEKLLQIQETQILGNTRDIQKEENFLAGDLGRGGTFEAPRQTEDVKTIMQERSGREQQIQEEIRLLMIENALLGSLSFASSKHRQQSVELPHQNTFQWIYDDSDTSLQNWSNFVDWLRTGSGIYWINGKAGSGKSTLMKYICQNNRTRGELVSWADKLPLEFSGFFFWNSGDENQKSQQGLLRSLLADILGRHRNLLPDVLPDAWDAWSARATVLTDRTLSRDSALLPPEPEPWTLAQLTQAFRGLILKLQQKTKLCLFIDGLDEYSGDNADLIELCRELAQFPNIKLCLSSRPLLAFCSAFDGLPGLKLQDLTQRDIGHYVRDRLGSDKNKMAKRYLRETQLLEKDIVEKAQGVFLWVKLVVRSLAQGLSDFTRISDLRRRVDHLPGDLEDLYAHMLRNVTDPFYHEQASQIFQIVQAAQQTSTSTSSMTLLKLSWAEEEDLHLAETAPIRQIDPSEVIERCQIMDARLKSFCAGLLESVSDKFSEIAPDSKVVFLHRTVSDWIMKPSVWNGILQHTANSGFSPNLCMLKSCVLQLKGLYSEKAFDSTLEPLDESVIIDALKYACAAETELAHGFPSLLDQLDVVISYHWRARGNPDHWTRGIKIPRIVVVIGARRFYDLATELGLSHYIASKDEFGGIVDHDVNLHLLQNTLSKSGTQIPDPQFIRKILSAGTSPNMSFHGVTPWEAALAGAASHLATRSGERSRRPSDSQEWERTAGIWADVLDVFLQHGADPQLRTAPVRTLTGYRRLTLMAVVEMLPESLASRAARLKALSSGSGYHKTRVRGGGRLNVTDSNESARGEASSVGSTENANSTYMASAIQWVGWAVSWLPLS